MEFVSTAEREHLRDTVREWLSHASSPTQVRAAMETTAGFDRAWWTRLATDVGAQGLLVDSRYGGGGGGFADLAVVLEEMGRVLYCGPFLSTAVVGAAALAGAQEADLGSRYLPLLASGDLVVGSALCGPGDRQPTLRATGGSGDSIAVSGTAVPVLDGAAADLLVLAAQTARGVGLVLVEADAERVVRHPLTTMDQTRRLARVELDHAPARLLVRDPVAARALVARVSELAWVALACEQVGGAQRCVELATEHARTRRQFGVPIGTFQAVKHACADMLASVELARTLTSYASWCADNDPADLPTIARAAKSFCSETYRQAAATTIQIHGGTGFTWAHPAHLYFKRAKSTELLFGQPAEHRAALGQLLGLSLADVRPDREEVPA